MSGNESGTAEVPACPACDSRDTEASGSIETALLSAGYAKYLGVDLDGLFDGIPRIAEWHCRQCDLSFFVPPVAGDNRFYMALGKLPWYYMSEKTEFSMVADLFANGTRVLEIGCGRGAFAARIAGAIYTGLEFSPAAVVQARAAGLDIRQQSIEDHARGHAGRYDVACSFQVLEHTPTPRSFIEAMAQSVKANGRVIVSVPSEDGFGGRIINDFLNLPPHHLTRWSDRALAGLGKRCGLVLERLQPEPLAPYHRGRFLAAWLASVFPLGLQGRPGRRVVTGSAQRLIWRLIAAFSQVVSRSWPAGVQALADRTRTRGHTVVAVFRKDPEGPIPELAVTLARRPA